MSHVVSIDVEIRDLEALAVAAKKLGLELVLGQKTYRWYGQHVGDYPMPIGFTAADLGKCEHALRIPGNASAYEIGVVARKDGRPGFQLVWDFWAGGRGLEAVAGKDCCHVRREYATAAARLQAQRLGYRVQEQRLEDGSVRLSISR